MTPARASKLRALRARVALAEGSGRRGGVLPFGDPRLDACFPAGGLPLGRWHELSGEGLEAETVACTGAFAAVQMGRVSCRERVQIWAVAGSLIKKNGIV